MSLLQCGSNAFSSKQYISQGFTTHAFHCVHVNLFRDKEQIQLQCEEAVRAV